VIIILINSTGNKVIDLGGAFLQLYKAATN